MGKIFNQNPINQDSFLLKRVVIQNGDHLILYCVSSNSSNNKHLSNVIYYNTVYLNLIYPNINICTGLFSKLRIILGMAIFSPNKEITDYYRLLELDSSIVKNKYGYIRTLLHMLCYCPKDRAKLINFTVLDNSNKSTFSMTLVMRNSIGHKLFPILFESSTSYKFSYKNINIHNNISETHIPIYYLTDIAGSNIKWYICTFNNKTLNSINYLYSRLINTYIYINNIKNNTIKNYIGIDFSLKNFKELYNKHIRYQK